MKNITMVKKGDHAPHPVDLHVGKRLKMRRALVGMSQEKLADSVGLTFQQVQKYERGANRISASKLFEFSSILDAPISYFFQNMDGGQNMAVTGLSDQEQEEISSEDVFQKKETLDLLNHYYSITDEKVRKNILSMIKSVAHSEK